MGITIQELLALEFFRDFYVVAGRKGLSKEIQGVTVFEAPDAYHWTKGKELILSSGYVMVKEPGSLEQAFAEGIMQKTSGMMIKRERYLKEIPKNIIQLFEENDLPLISMPYAVPYMDVMNQVNTAVMNRIIRRFRIHSSTAYSLSNMTYKERKVKRILQAVESEMHFPALLYDMNENRAYYSSVNFIRITDSIGLTTQELWEPSVPCTKHTLCDDIHMVRIRLVQQQEGARMSWITIPVTVNNMTQAYFVVMESRNFLDYYDEYAIRISYLMLQSVYEQILIAQNVGNIGFENFVHYMLDFREQDPEKLVYQANIQGISMSSQYFYVVFWQENPEFGLRQQRKRVMELFAKNQLSTEGKLIFLEENEAAIFLSTGEFESRKPEVLREYLESFRRKVTEEFPEAGLRFGMLSEPASWTGMRKNIEKCRNVLRMGSVLCPEQPILDYESLGPLAWLQIPTDELEEMLKNYRLVMSDEKGTELLKTLKIYLENNMNYSVTAEKMFVHINTIRNRIEKINRILGTDWDNYINRMKAEILLQFLQL